MGKPLTSERSSHYRIRHFLLVFSPMFPYGGGVGRWRQKHDVRRPPYDLNLHQPPVIIDNYPFYVRRDSTSHYKFLCSRIAESFPYFLRVHTKCDCLRAVEGAGSYPLQLNESHFQIVLRIFFPFERCPAGECYACSKTSTQLSVRSL